MKRTFIIFINLLMISFLYGMPRMITINNQELSIEMSETVVTLGDFKDYLKRTGKDQDNIENLMKSQIDEQSYELRETLPIWGITWLEAAEYCNWLSRDNHLVECYIFFKK